MHDQDRLLTGTEVAGLVRKPVATLRWWGHVGIGPMASRSVRSESNRRVAGCGDCFLTSA